MRRKEAEDFILKHLKELAPGSITASLYEKRFKSMSDQDFEAFMSRIESGEEFLVVHAPNFSNSGISVEKNLKLGEKLGYQFFQRVWIGKKANEPAYLTPVKYLVLDLPLRRASQLLIKKIRIPLHNKTHDTLTGQPTGDSKGAKISYPELQVLASMGLDNSVIELIKFRGGDVKGHNAMSAMINRYGQTNLKTLANFSSGVESTKTLNTFLTSMHLKSNLTR